MNPDDHRDQLIDMLLREVVGGETPPDVRERVLAAAGKMPAKPMTQKNQSPARSVIQRPSSSRSSRPIVAMAALLAVMGVAMVFVHSREIAKARTPAVAHVSGSVDRSAATLRPGESVSTGARSSALLTYPDGTAVELEADTTLRMSPRSWRDRSKGLDLVTGRIRADVAPQGTGSPMALTAGHAKAEVIGTKLSFQHDDERTRLEVTEGTVRFIPEAGDLAVLIKSGLFAEAGKSGVRSGTITAAPRRGIVRLTLMNADSDEPLREAALSDGEVISLAALPTRNINIRADYDGEAPASVRIGVTRADGQFTGLRASTSEDQTHPPFFAAGDHWTEGRPKDCRAWTPPAGLYRITAKASYAGGAASDQDKPLEMKFRITE